MNIQKIEQLINDGYINVQKHPTENLWIYNYSHKAQYDNIRGYEVEMCRGLIMDVDHSIIARGFRKFYNWDQALSYGEQFPLTGFEVTEKEDGSLGILYHLPTGEPCIATRGSFTSEQAVEANQILTDKYRDVVFDPRFTYLFEIVVPWNRIVLDYGDMEDLILLSIIETKTGVENSYESVKRFGERHGFPVVKRYDGITDFSTLAVADDREGFVIHWPETGQRVKVKGENYKYLHKILTQTNARTIWEVLKVGGSLEQILDRTPDEFNNFVRTTVDELSRKYLAIELTARKSFEDIFVEDETKKDFAAKAMETMHAHVLFAMYDNKDYSGYIWKLLKPEAEKPFKANADDQ